MHVKGIGYFKNKIIMMVRVVENCKVYFNQVLLGKKVNPQRIYIEPTNICNANCIFCAYQFYDAKKEVMSLEILDKVLKEAKSLGIKSIDLTPFAGEIFTDKNIMQKLRVIASYKFESVSTYTNLISLKKENIDDFLNSGITSLHISASPLDKELHKKIFRSSKYEQFLENLICLLDRFNKIEKKTIKTINIEFRSNISHSKCLKLPDYVNKVQPLVERNKNIKVVTMQTFDNWMGAIKNSDLLDGMKLDKPNGKKLIPCNRLNNVQVLSNGDMRICGCRFNNESIEDIFFIGNIKDISILEAYNSKKVRKIKSSFLKYNPPIECQRCTWYNK